VVRYASSTNVAARDPDRTGGVTAGTRPTPEQLLASYPPPIRHLADEIRKTLLAAVPSFVERALPGWRAIAFRDLQAGHVCALFPFEDHLKLYVEYGATLPDPDGLMDGSMKRGRYIAFRTPKDLRKRALARLIRRAVVAQSV
jgi:hypothetical protein